MILNNNNNNKYKWKHRDYNRRINNRFYLKCFTWINLDKYLMNTIYIKIKKRI